MEEHGEEVVQLKAEVERLKVRLQESEEAARAAQQVCSSACCFSITEHCFPAFLAGIM